VRIGDTPKGNATEERKVNPRRRSGKQEKKISKVSFQHSRAIGWKQVKGQGVGRKTISRECKGSFRSERGSVGGASSRVEQGLIIPADLRQFTLSLACCRAAITSVLFLNPQKEECSGRKRGYRDMMILFDLRTSLPSLIQTLSGGDCIRNSR
jgi:hypothetical protein